MFTNILFLSIFVHYHNLPCKAVIAEGPCPKAKDNPFDCHQIVNSLKPNTNRPIKINIYALIPSSTGVESLNIFAFDVTPAIIASFQAHFDCTFGVFYVLCDGTTYVSPFP